jgi:hypothetical protein
MSAAERGDHVAPLHALGSRPHPLVRARDVDDQLTRPQESAEDLVHRGKLCHVAGTDCCQGLVGEDHSLLDAIGHHEQTAEICQGQDLDVGIAESASDGDRVPEQRLPHLCVRF